MQKTSYEINEDYTDAGKKKTAHVKAYRDIIIVQEFHQDSALKEWNSQ